MCSRRVIRYRWMTRSTVLLMLAGALGGCGEPSPPPAAAPPIERYPATDESIAFTNLDFTIDSARQVYASRLDGQLAAKALVASLLTRARFKNSVADLEEADEVASNYVEAAPDSADAWLVKAEVDIAVHRFVEAQAAIDRASSLGAPAESIASRQSVLLTATGRAAEALADVEAMAKENPDYLTYTRLASVYQAMGDTAQSEVAYTNALKAYGDVSPFAVAWVQFERGMLAVESDPDRAVALFDEALHYLPSYVSARTDRAAALAANGDVDAAIEALEKLCAEVDDPEPAGLLAGLLIDEDRQEEAAPWRERAHQGYEARLGKYRLAFADHAAEFYLRVEEPESALALAEENLRNRDTPRSRSLVEQARSALAAQRS